MTVKKRHFYWECIKRAFTGVGGYVGDVSLVASMAIAWMHSESPSWYRSSGAKDLIDAIGGWMMPTFIFASLSLIRLVLAPYWVYKDRIDSASAQRDAASLALKEATERQKPKLEISCSTTTAGCRVPCGHNGHGRAFRVRVSNLGLEAIEDCRGFLLSIAKDDQQLWGGDQVTLTFQPSEDSDATSKTILHGIPTYLDVMFVEMGDSSPWKFKPGTKNHEWRTNPSFQHIFACDGVYVLKIAISAPAMASIVRDYSFTWTGNLETAELRLV